MGGIVLCLLQNRTVIVFASGSPNFPILLHPWSSERGDVIRISRVGSHTKLKSQRSIKGFTDSLCAIPD
jgi:hypothetical protein